MSPRNHGGDLRMDDLVHETKVDLSKQRARKLRDRAKRAIERSDPTAAARALREAADAYEELAELESLPAVAETYSDRAVEMQSLAEKFESTGMDAVDTAAASAPERVGDDASDIDLRVPVETPALSFEDVGGLSDVKQKLIDKVADPIRRKELYQQYGIDPVRGVLLQGPPGTGKTLLTRALGGELGWNFMELSPAQINSALVGQGAQNIQDVFSRAREHQPCIIFFDEIENIAKDRTSTTQSTRSEEALLTQMLTEMNDLDDDDIVVIGATNQPEEVDDALLNARRFSEVIEITLPDVPARKAILKVHLRGPQVPVETIDFDRAANLTEGFAGDDIEQVATNAARNALDEAEATGSIVPITQTHLEAGIDERRASMAEAQKGGYLSADESAAGGA